MKKNKIHAAQNAANKKRQISATTTILATSVLMCAAIIWFLGIDGADYLRKIEMRSLFQPTSDFFRECMRQPGGVLIWASTFMTQMMYHPWLGTATYLILTAITVLTAWRAFRIPAYGIPALLIIPSATVLALLNLGYVIFSLKSPGFAFLLPVGTLISIVIFWGYRSVRQWWIRLIIAAGIPLCCYGLLGYYALLSGSLMGAAAVIGAIRAGKSWWQETAITAASVFAIIATPAYWVKHISSDVPETLIYLSPLPRFYEGEEWLWLPYMVIAAMLLLLSLWCSWQQGKEAPETTNATTLGAAAVGLAAVAALVICRYTDSNFKLTLKLDHHLWEQQWTSAADEMAKFTDEPTRLNTFLCDIALIRSGQAPESLFAYPIGSAPYTTERALRVPHDAGSMLLSYHFGLINYAYRWAMEYKVEYGTNVEQLMMMTKCALLNGEYALARKCTDALALTAFHKDWAKRYRQMADNPELISQDPELAAIKPLMPEKNVFITDNNQLEGYIWSELANVETGGEELLELSLISALVCREIDAFAERLPFYARLHETLPRHFQEGILIWSMVHNNDQFRRYRIDQNVKDDFRRFVQMQHQYENLTLDEQRELMRPSFGNTYWFYALYQRGQQII